MGSGRSVAGRLPALSTPTSVSVSSWVKLPVISPRSKIVLWIDGAVINSPSRMMPSLCVKPVTGSGRLVPVSLPNNWAPVELKAKVTQGWPR